MILKKMHWLFPVVVSVHNLEEAILFPSWSRNTHLWSTPVENNEFIFAIFILTILAYLSTYLNSISKNNSILSNIFYGYCMSMLLNAIFPHTIYSLITRSYMPGLISGLLLNVPVSGFTIYSAFNNNIIKRWNFYLYSILVSVGLIVSIPMLFAIGRIIS